MTSPVGFPIFQPTDDNKGDRPFAPGSIKNVVASVVAESLSKHAPHLNSQNRLSLVTDQILSLKQIDTSTHAKNRSPSIVVKAAQANLSLTEQSSLIDLIHNWPLSSKSCLLDLVGADIYTSLSGAHKLSNLACKEKLTPLIRDFHRVLFYIHLRLMAASSNDASIQKSLDRGVYFPTISHSSGDLIKLTLKFQVLKNELASETPDTSTSLGRLQAKLQTGVCDRLNQAIERLLILEKLLNHKATIPLLLDVSLGLFAEGAWIESVDLPKRLSTLQAYAGFIQAFCTQSSDFAGICTDQFATFQANIARLAIPKQQESACKQFYQLHNQASGVISNLQISFALYAQTAASDPSYTREEYCKEHNAQLVVKNGTQESFIDMLNQNFVTTLIWAGWLQDIHHIVSNHIVPSLERQLPTSLEYVRRIMVTLEATMVLFSSENALPIQEPPVALEFRAHIRPLLKTFFSSHVEPLKLNMQTILPAVVKISNAPVFSLGPWLITLSPLEELAANLDATLKNVSSIESLILEWVKSVEVPSNSKELLKTVLWEELLPYCMMTMLLHDIDTLFKGTSFNPQDIEKLVPDSFVSLLELEGFEDLFHKEEPPLVLVVEKPPLSSSSPPVTIIKEAHASVSTTTYTSQAKEAEQPLFSKQDFLKAKKRSWILKMLEQAGFFARKGKGSHVVMSNSETGATTVVPQDVSDAGLRGAIFKQAFPDQT